MPTPDQIAFYRENGYLVVEDVLTDDEIAAARAATEEWVDRSRAASESDDTFDLEPGHGPDDPRLRRLKEPTTKSEVFEKIARHPGILDVVEGLIGPDIRFQASKLNMKAAGYGSPLEWHQDVAFYPHTNDDLCAVGVAFDDCALDNGVMMVIPGSHKGPILNHNHNGYFVGGCDQSHPLITESEHVPLVMKAGSISIHHVRTFHASAPNTSGRPRRLLLLQYTAADAYPLNFTIAAPGKLVRGEERGYARLSAQPPIPVHGKYPEKAGSIYDLQLAMEETTFQKSTEALERSKT